jgi:hypothetical protein
LASFCWTKSLLCNDAFKPGSTIQSASRRFCTVYRSEKSDPLQPSERHDIPSRYLTVQSIIRQNDVKFPSGPSSLSKSFELLRLHPSGRFSSMSGRHSVFDQLWDFLPKHRYGKILATVRTMWIPVRTCSSIRQVAHSKSRRPDANLHGLNARAI